ncbi:MAG: RadC family protein [Aminipila sp.]
MKCSKRVDVVKVQIVKETSIKYMDRVIKSSDEAGNLIKIFIGKPDREQFGVMCIDTKGQPTNISIVAVGDLNCTIVHPREVFKTAILSNAASVILFHNHPSGIELPSMEDRNITKRLCDAGLILGIKVLDHVILGDMKTFSFKNNGLVLEE